MDDRPYGTSTIDGDSLLVKIKNEVSQICPLKLDGKPQFDQLIISSTYYHPYYWLSMVQSTWEKR